MARAPPLQAPACRRIWRRPAYLSQKLTRPVPTKDGGLLRTIAEARDYMLALPDHRELRQSWQRAAELLLAQADVILVSQQIQLALFPRLQTRPCGDDMKKKRRYRPRLLGDQIMTPRIV
jgi:hypothetical protein